jgi:hypothetical protein
MLNSLQSGAVKRGKLTHFLQIKHFGNEERLAIKAIGRILQS